jgi:hypothetical protein
MLAVSGCEENVLFARFVFGSVFQGRQQIRDAQLAHFSRVAWETAQSYPNTLACSTMNPVEPEKVVFAAGRWDLAPKSRNLREGRRSTEQIKSVTVTVMGFIFILLLYTDPVEVPRTMIKKDAFFGLQYYCHSHNN